MVTILQHFIDFIFRLLPQATPSLQQVNSAKLVAHRGAHKYGVKENTLKGFERCIEQGVWGIEFDVRWTKDHEPVLIHDKNAGQVYHRPDIIPHELTIPELKQEIPEIPTLEEVVNRYGGQIHFMIELKRGFSSHASRLKRLDKVLAPLQAVQDYHMMSLYPEELLSLAKTPKAAMIGISLVNTKRIAKIVKTNKIGGHCGHYLLLNKRIYKSHKLEGIKTGTGYVASRNSLFREINRGVDWSFTNKPFEMQFFLDELNRKNT